MQIENNAIKDFLSLLHNGTAYAGRPIFFVKRGMSKTWIKAIEMVLKAVPDEAKPEFIGNFGSWVRATSRKINKAQKMSKYGVTLPLQSLHIKKEDVTADVMEQYINNSMKSAADMMRLLELQDVIQINTYQIKEANIFNIVGFNTVAYKNPEALDKHKAQINATYQQSNNKDWHVNSNTKFGTIYHEFGHVFDNNKRSSDSSKWNTIHSKWVLDGAPDVCKSKREAFAEAFANVVGAHGDNVPDYVTKYIKSII